jgi:transposase
LFAGSDKGGKRIANILTIIETVKIHGHNPEAYFTHILTMLRDYPKESLHELLPWIMAPAKPVAQAVA